jgi:hypothetical protein
MIKSLDGHLAVPTDDATDLLATLDLLADVLRYASDELHADIVDRHQPGTHQYLIDTLEHHAGMLRRAIRPGHRRAVTA